MKKVMDSINRCLFISQSRGLLPSLHEGLHSDDKLSEEQMVSCLVLPWSQLKNLKVGS